MERKIIKFVNWIEKQIGESTTFYLLIVTVVLPIAIIGALLIHSILWSIGIIFNL